MKRADLIRDLESHGCLYVREGGSHTVYRNPANGQASTIPRHREIKKHLARKICDDLGQGSASKKDYWTVLWPLHIRLCTKSPNTPADFAFRLKREEAASLMSQIAISSSANLTNRWQFATSLKVSARSRSQ